MNDNKLFPKMPDRDNPITEVDPAALQEHLERRAKVRALSVGDFSKIEVRMSENIEAQRAKSAETRELMDQAKLADPLDWDLEAMSRDLAVKTRQKKIEVQMSENIEAQALAMLKGEIHYCPPGSKYPERSIEDIMNSCPAFDAEMQTHFTTGARSGGVNQALELQSAMRHVINLIESPMQKDSPLKNMAYQLRSVVMMLDDAMKPSWTEDPYAFHASEKAEAQQYDMNRMPFKDLPQSVINAQSVKAFTAATSAARRFKAMDVSSFDLASEPDKTVTCNVTKAPDTSKKPDGYFGTPGTIDLVTGETSYADDKTLPTNTGLFSALHK